jgi:hypothetical protein
MRSALAVCGEVPEVLLEFFGGQPALFPCSKRPVVVGWMPVFRARLSWEMPRWVRSPRSRWAERDALVRGHPGLLHADHVQRVDAPGSGGCLDGVAIEIDDADGCEGQERGPDGCPVYVVERVLQFGAAALLGMLAAEQLQEDESFGAWIVGLVGSAGAEVVAQELVDATAGYAGSSADLGQGQALNEAQAEHLQVALAWDVDMAEAVCRQGEAKAVELADYLVELGGADVGVRQQFVAGTGDKLLDVGDAGCFQAGQCGGAEAQLGDAHGKPRQMEISPSESRCRAQREAPMNSSRR